MPNWTRNELTIQADDPKDIKEFKEKSLQKMNLVIFSLTLKR